MVDLFFSLFPQSLLDLLLDLSARTLGPKIGPLSPLFRCRSGSGFVASQAPKRHGYISSMDDGEGPCLPFLTAGSLPALSSMID